MKRSYDIPEASRDGRLYLRKGVGPLSSGTKVKLVSYDPERQTAVVSAEITVYKFGKPERMMHGEKVPTDMLVIRRSRS